MKALVFETPDNPVIMDMPVPLINESEVLIKTSTIGICHSDFELLAGRYIIPISYPVTPSHEWCGEIVEVGKNVKNFKKGDRVVGECVVRTPERLHHFGFSMNGADREYFNVNPDWLHKLPDGVDDNRGALIEPFTCGFYAVLRSGGRGAELVVEASGHDASVANVFEYTQENGRVSMVGLNIGRKVTSTLGLLQLKNLTVRGCIGSPGVWPAAIKFLERTGIDLSPIQTHHFSLLEARKAFELGQDPQACIKVTLSTKGLN